MGQLQVDLASLEPITRPLLALASSPALGRDRDIRGLLACCLVDVLVLYAPEPPYNELELGVRQGYPFVISLTHSI